MLSAERLSSGMNCSCSSSSSQCGPHLCGSGSSIGCSSRCRLTHRRAHSRGGASIVMVQCARAPSPDQEGAAAAAAASIAVSQSHSKSLVQTLVSQSVSTNGAGTNKVPTVDIASAATAGVLETDGGSTRTQFVAETLLPTRHGKLRLRGYKHSVDGGLTYTEPTAIIAGNVEGREDVPVRVHDACYTSEVLGSLKCDCADQLNLALDMITDNPPGMVIYLQQEGRGIGLANKIAAYALQEEGLDTVDANRALGLPDDCREYTSVRNILLGLGIKSVQLITNNPRKINELKSLGLCISGRIPCIADTCNEHNEEYLQAKQARMNHLLEERQSCFWNHEGEPALPSIATQAKQKGIRTGIQVPDLSPAASNSPTIPFNGGNGAVQSSQQQQQQQKQKQ
ncbi:GTP cyclohydrolase II-domain-containing protein [Dunaliella salina]|uniref:GTP cyclohydrolase II n=1 Tax=Dunaliella salina TaxID=3046 RepID=A0ABQ7GAU1_DUNSA|nr:GTP cyclohydrolase II-domain-containing protein [Dunaliella salina]|eukprot:KAF5831720.1 GTP cyclohydrolase II-domain-containing protein [Dunaliella salina]